MGVWYINCFNIKSLLVLRFAAIHAEAPEFVEMSVEQEILVTGIKVVDLLAPYAKGGKIGKLAYIHIDSSWGGDHDSSVSRLPSKILGFFSQPVGALYAANLILVSFTDE